jgi:hypothetical protein
MLLVLARGVSRWFISLTLSCSLCSSRRNIQAVPFVHPFLPRPVIRLAFGLSLNVSRALWIVASECALRKPTEVIPHVACAQDYDPMKGVAITVGVMVGVPLGVMAVAVTVGVFPGVLCGEGSTVGVVVGSIVGVAVGVGVAVLAVATGVGVLAGTEGVSS